MAISELTREELVQFRFNQLAGLQGYMNDEDFLACSDACHNYRKAVARGDEKWIDQTDSDFRWKFAPFLHRAITHGVGSRLVV